MTANQFARLAGVVALALPATVGVAPNAAAQVVETAIPGDPVETSAGSISGKVLESGVHAYLGVPFAEPPLRDLRWKAPRAHTPWEGVYHADRKAPECMQTLRDSNINHYFGEESLSEDCLYLNMWVPSDAEPGDDLPVVAWIYGGGFNVGSTNMANYSGEQLAQKGVIYVAIAYRLGAMGFMAHPELAAESDTGTSGNYGLMDQAFGLKWVQDNIGAFGGDADNVMIVGQSAGSMSLSALQVSPSAEGRFDKIFGMSGSVVNAFASPYEQAESAGLEIQEQLEASSLEDLRAVSSDRFLDVEGARLGLAIGGNDLPQSAWDAYQSGDFADVPMVIGFTKDEAFSGLASAESPQELRAMVEDQYGDDAEALLEVYQPEQAEDFERIATDMGRDTSMGIAMYDWAVAQSQYGDEPVYAYMFSRTQPYTEGVTFADHDPETAGAYHTVEVPYFLDTLDSLNMFRETRTWTDLDRELRDRASGALISFAKTGDPNSGAFDWPRFTVENPDIVEFDINSIDTGEWPHLQAMEILHQRRTTD